MNNPRFAFIALAAASGLAVTFAIVTTSSQVARTHAAVLSPVPTS